MSACRLISRKRFLGSRRDPDSTGENSPGGRHVRTWLADLDIYCPFVPLIFVCRMESVKVPTEKCLLVLICLCRYGWFFCMLSIGMTSMAFPVRGIYRPDVDPSTLLQVSSFCRNCRSLDKGRESIFFLWFVIIYRPKNTVWRKAPPDRLR